VEAFISSTKWNTFSDFCRKIAFVRISLFGEILFVNTNKRESKMFNLGDFTFPEF
jgi:hypothetical protein